MRSKKAKLLRKAINLVCVGQEARVTRRAYRLVKKHHKLFNSTDSLQVRAMKVMAFINSRFGADNVRTA